MTRPSSRKAAVSKVAVACQYCGRPATYLADSRHLFGGRDFGPVWRCEPCGAHVGCHPDGLPKGTLANAALRSLRSRVHARFDPLWSDWQGAYPEFTECSKKVKNLTRTRAYEWLGFQLGLSADRAHIAMFDDEQCRRAIEIIKSMNPTAASVRAWASEHRARLEMTARAYSQYKRPDFS